MLTDNLFIVSHERGTFSGRVQSIISKPSLGTLPQSRALPRWRRANAGEGAREQNWFDGGGYTPKVRRKKHLPIVTLCLIVTDNRTAHPDHLV